MKLKSFMMAMAAVAFVSVVSSCSSDDDNMPEVAVVSQVVGTYTGNEIVMVMGEESSNETKSYSFEKVTDTSVNMLIPEMGMGGHMSIPAFQVKNIPLTKSGNTVRGQLDSYAGTVTNASGSEKAYTVSQVTVIFSDKTVAVTFSLKYGNMPMSMETTFTGNRQ